MSRRIQYTEEFKRGAVSQVKDGGYSVRDVAERLGICTKSLYAWVRQCHKPEKGIQEDKEQAAEIRRLRLEGACVKEEMLAFKGMTTKIHHKKQQGKPISKTVARGNSTKSKIRAKVEHVFAV